MTGSDPIEERGLGRLVERCLPCAALAAGLGFNLLMYAVARDPEQLLPEGRVVSTPPAIDALHDAVMLLVWIAGNIGALAVALLAPRGDRPAPIIEAEPGN